MRTYATPAAFKEALEARLRKQARAEQQDMNRLRTRLVMDRLAARIGEQLPTDVILKGGVVMELRLANARATKDLDIHLHGQPARTLHAIKSASRAVGDDFLSFHIEDHPRHPHIEAEGLHYEGFRFRVQALLAGKPYGGAFGLDAVFAEPFFGEPEALPGSDLLAFIGIPTPVHRVYPVLTHIAEKLHAYTQPRARPNSRVKDLPDLALLASADPYRSEAVLKAIEVTYQHRSTHERPQHLPTPPQAWTGPYQRMAKRDHLPWQSLDEVFVAAARFLNPVLDGQPGQWNPGSWSWEQ